MYEIILNINDIYVAIFLGILGSVYIETLADEEGILSGYYKLLTRLYSKYPYLAKPLGFCQYCMIGQIALWSYVFIYWNEYDLFHIVKNIFFITLSIFMVDVFQKITVWSRKN